jgi:hypothetical protein
MLINFPELKQNLRGYEEVILHHLLPNGRKQGCEYVALNPTRVDRNLGSFRINIHTQQWADFATEDRGGDLISLWAYVRNIKNVEAAKQLLKLMER